jgi:hypothetical protein
MSVIDNKELYRNLIDATRQFMQFARGHVSWAIHLSIRRHLLRTEVRCVYRSIHAVVASIEEHAVGLLDKQINATEAVHLCSKPLRPNLSSNATPSTCHHLCLLIVPGRNR